MKKKVRLTQTGEKIVVIVILGMIILGALFYNSYVRIPQIENNISQK